MISENKENIEAKLLILSGGQRRDRSPALLMESVTYRFQMMQKAPKVPECPNGLAISCKIICVREYGDGKELLMSTPHAVEKDQSSPLRKLVKWSGRRDSN